MNRDEGPGGNRGRIWLAAAISVVFSLVLGCGCATDSPELILSDMRMALLGVPPAAHDGWLIGEEGGIVRCAFRASSEKRIKSRLFVGLAPPHGDADACQPVELDLAPGLPQTCTVNLRLRPGPSLPYRRLAVYRGKPRQLLAGGWRDQAAPGIYIQPFPRPQWDVGFSGWEGSAAEPARRRWLFGRGDVLLPALQGQWFLHLAGVAYPDCVPRPPRLMVRWGGSLSEQETDGEFEMNVPVGPAETETTVQLTASPTFRPRDCGLGPDERELGAALSELRLSRITFDRGVYPPESDGCRMWRWTGPAARIVALPQDHHRYIAILGRASHRCRLALTGGASAEWELSPGVFLHWAAIQRTGRQNSCTVDVAITPPHLPADGRDNRALGIQIEEVALWSITPNE